MTELQTTRLRMRRARPDDLVQMHAVMSDEAVMRFWSTPPHRDLDQTREWLTAMIVSRPDVSDDFVITLDGEVVGKLGAFRLPEIGFILAHSLWSRGIASEALEAFLAHAFARPDVDRLTADVDPRNAGSLALLERHGFVRTGFAAGSWQTHIGLCDSVYLALERELYLATR